MNAIKLKINGKKYLFSEKGSVLEEALTPTTDGWTSLAAVTQDRNTLAYTLNGIPQRRLRARYSFNSDNQLVASFFKSENPELDEDSSTALAGGIRADDKLNIMYRLIDAEGNDQNAITVYGKPALENPFILKIDLDGGGEARITANKKKDPLEWDVNRQTDIGTLGDDLLKFLAMTRNNLQTIGGAGYQFNKAGLDFIGIWGMDKNGLFFDIEGGLDKPIRLNLQGSYKATSGALVFEYDSGNVKFVMNIGGRVEFDQGSATWKISIGHSQQARKTSTALKLEGELKQKIGKGKELTLSGVLKYEEGSASAPVVNLDITATYQFSGGACLIKAFYKTEGGVQTYGLNISGNVLFREGKLTYNFTYGSDKTISFEVLYEGTSDEFFNYFRLKVDVDAKGKVSCDFSFRISFTFENGVLLPVQAGKKAA